jgi:ketosteroid isomerase-like protein
MSITRAPSSLDLDPTAAFVAFFADGWRIGATQPQRFFDHFGSRMTADAVMIQPLTPVGYGPRGLRAQLEPVFRLIPDLRGEVVRWGRSEDGVLIELALRGTLGGRPIEWVTLDRIVLRDGRMAGRRAHFDSLPLIGALARRPWALARLLLMRALPFTRYEPVADRGAAARA